MAEQSAMNELFSRFGNELNQGHAAHKADTTKYSEFGDLPGGIDNGVAQLVECKLVKIKADAKANAGQWMFYAAGIVHFPIYAVDVKKDAKGNILSQEKVLVKGLRTKIQEIIAPTPDKKRATIADHIAYIYNELRKLGVDTSKLSSFKDIEPVMAALKKRAPYFKFRTWKGDVATSGPYAGKEPIVNEFWNGVCDDPYKDSQNTAGSAGSPPASAHSGVTDNTAASTVPDPEPSPDPEGAVTETEAGGETSEADILSLGEAANNGDDSASDRLRALALEKGFTDAQVDGAESWNDVASMLITGASEPEATSPEEVAAPEEPKPQADWKPVKDDIYMYRVLGPDGNPVKDAKTKRPAKPVECIVTAVNAKNRTVDLKNNTDKKTTYKAVSWDALEDGQ